MAKEHDCRLEVNTGGVYRGYRKDFYPGAWLLGEWQKMGGRVIITADAHDTASLTFDLTKQPLPSGPQASPRWMCSPSTASKHRNCNGIIRMALSVPDGEGHFPV